MCVGGMCDVQQCDLHGSCQNKAGEVNARLSCSVEHAMVFCMLMRTMVCSWHMWTNEHMVPCVGSTQTLTLYKCKTSFCTCVAGVLPVGDLAATIAAEPSVLLTMAACNASRVTS